MPRARVVSGNTRLANGQGATTRRLVGHTKPPVDKMRNVVSVSSGSKRAVATYNPGNGVERVTSRQPTGQRGVPLSVDSSRVQFPPNRD